MHYVINTGQHLQKTLIFAPFWGQQPPHGESDFGKSSDNSREVCFISLGHLLVFISRLESPFPKKTVQKYFFHVFSIYLYREMV